VKRATAEDGLVNKSHCGQKNKVLPGRRDTKIALAANKRHQTWRKLANHLTRAGYSTSKVAVHHYFRENSLLQAS